ncbi:MAG: pantetheine-phosphate adenylyltransferase, partial [Pelagibacteraceae bacterium]|nr:pantetheine-phosphate adenylyltransferase [Pelagibacteraceae bacterium]
LTFEERKDIIVKDIDLLNLGIKEIEIHSVTGLLTEFAKKHKAICIIRGLRAVSDFEYEFKMTGMNYQLNPEIETVFLMSSDNNSFISSSLVKEVHKLGGDVSKFVSENTIKVLNKKNSSS